MTALVKVDTSRTKPIDEIAIRNRVGERSFERGLQYSRTRAIFEARRQGNTLKARCEGNRAIPYRVQATLGANGQLSASCTCPVGHDGQCKHVAALLLTWQSRPEEFVEIEDVDQALARRSKDELMVLVKQMLRQQPDLELLLETPLPVPGCYLAVASETYRRQAAAIFRHAGYAYGVVDDVARALLAIIAIGDDFSAQGRFATAAAVYVGVLDELRDQYAAYVDEEEVLSSVGRVCVEGLGRCLDNELEDTPGREVWLRSLWKTYTVDLALGATILSRSVVSTILGHSAPAEHRLVAGWVRDEIGCTKDKLRQTELGELLLDLELEFFEDEEYYRICRETGRYARLIDRLLAREQLDEALAEATRLDDDFILDVADTFDRYGRRQAFEDMLTARASTTNNPSVLEWLQKSAEERADLTNAYWHGLRLFELRGNFDDYRELRRLAQETGRWHSLRNLILAKLRGRHAFLTLVQVFLDEGETDRALELVGCQKMIPQGANDSDFGLALEVARAAEVTRPRQASEIYQRYAEHLIAQRGRNNYVTACDVLRRTRQLLTNSGDAATWDEYLATLRQRHRALRAFQDELILAGL
ncbi:MAG TPA: SWIM zinc finger family protein [Chloroflexota bacterium]|nr:SWIM zinc finger family protein [Chloroflexota bacterium]